MAGEVGLGTVAAYLKLNTAQFFEGLEKANVGLGAFGVKAEKELAGVAGVSGKTASAVATHAAHISTAMLGAGVGIAAGLGMAVKSAADWQTHMTTIQGNTTLTSRQIKAMGDQALETARQTGAGANDIADAYMHVTNLGYNLADSQKIVAAATKSAVSAGAESATTSKTLAQVMREMNIPVADAAKTMDTLHIASANSTVPLEDFIHAGSRVFGVAGAMHLSLNQVLAMSVALTKHGFPDASEAMTQMVGIMTHMRSPAKGASDALQAIDLIVGTNLTRDFTAWGMATKGPLVVLNETKAAATSFGQELKSKLHPGMELTKMQALGLAHILSIDLSGAVKNGTLDVNEYNAAIKALANHQGDWTRVMDRVIPAQRGGLGGQALVSTGALDAADLLHNKLTHAGGSVDTAYAAKLKTAAQQTKMLDENIHALAVNLGTVLLPPVVKLTGELVKVVSSFNNLPGPVKNTVVAAAAGAAGFLLVGGAIIKIVTVGATLIGWLSKLAPLVEAATAAWGSITFAFEAVAGGAATVGEGLGLVVAALGGPVTLAIGAAVAVAAGLALAWKTDFGHIREVTAGAVDWLKSAIPNALNWIKATWHNIWTGIIRGHEDEWNEITAVVRAGWEAVKADAAIAWAGLKAFFGDVFNALSAQFQGAFTIIKLVVGTAWDAVKAITLATWSMVKGMVKAAFDVLKTIFQVGMDVLTGHWSRAWTTLKTGAVAIWNDVKGAFQGVLSAIIGFITSFGSRLHAAGAGMLHAFVQGIESMASAPVDAVKAMAARLAAYLPHSDADTGPLSKLTASGRAVGTTFASGIRAGTPAVSAAMRQMVEEAWNARQAAWSRRQQAAQTMQNAEAAAHVHDRRAAAYQTDLAQITGKGHQGERKRLELLAREERAIAEGILDKARDSAATQRHIAAVDAHTATVKAHAAAEAKAVAVAHKRDVSAAMKTAEDQERAAATLDSARALAGMSGTSGLVGSGPAADMRAKRDTVLGAEATRIQGLRAELSALNAQAEVAKGKGDLEPYKSILEQVRTTTVDIATSVAQEKADRAQITQEINAAEAAARAGAAAKKVDHSLASAARAAALNEARQARAEDEQRHIEGARAIRAEKLETAALNTMQAAFNESVKTGLKHSAALAELTRRNLELTQGKGAAERHDAYQQYLKDKLIDPKMAQQDYDATLAKIDSEGGSGGSGGASVAGMLEAKMAAWGTRQLGGSFLGKLLGNSESHAWNRDMTGQEPHTGITENEDGTFNRPRHKDKDFAPILESLLLPGGGGKGGGLQGILSQILGGSSDSSGSGILHPSLQKILGGTQQDGILGGLLSGILGGGKGGGGGALGGLTGLLGPWAPVASLGIGLLGGLFGGGHSGPAAPTIERPGSGDVIHIHNDLKGAFFPDQRSVEHLAEMVAQKTRAQKRLRTI